MGLGPWFIMGCPLVTRPWLSELRFEVERLKVIPFWVRHSSLSLKFWSPRILGSIFSILGRSLLMDEATSNASKLSFAYVCVEIGVDFVFARSVPMRNQNSGMVE